MGGHVQVRKGLPESGSGISCVDWTLEGLLERAGFRMDQAASTGGVLGDDYCTRAGYAPFRARFSSPR